MKEKEMAFTYEEYRNGAKQVAGLGRLNCYKGLDYLIKLLEKEEYYSEELEDTVVFIESHINRIEKENQKYKETIDKAIEYLKKWGIEPDADMYWRINEYKEYRELLAILKEVE